MKRFEFNKLVRNKLPSRMREEGVIVHDRSLNLEEYRLKLRQKLLEEAKEAAEAPTLDELKRELADVLETIHALLGSYTATFGQVEMERLMKRDINGFFTSETYIDYIEVASSNQKVIDYLLNKNRPYKFTPDN